VSDRETRDLERQLKRDPGNAELKTRLLQVKARTCQHQFQKASREEWEEFHKQWPDAHDFNICQLCQGVQRVMARDTPGAPRSPKQEREDPYAQFFNLILRTGVP
jgi:hypothetical protein